MIPGEMPFTYNPYLTSKLFLILDLLSSVVIRNSRYRHTKVEEKAHTGEPTFRSDGRKTSGPDVICVGTAIEHLWSRPDQNQTLACDFRPAKNNFAA